jgi:hypothetical protein
MRLSAALCVLIAFSGTTGFGQEKVQKLKKVGPLPQSQGLAQADNNLDWFDTPEGQTWLNSPQGMALSMRLVKLQLQIDQANKILKELVETSQRIAETGVPSKPSESKPDFSVVKLHLAGWKSACSQQMDKGVAMALAEGKPALTYQAATALDCTESLRNIMEEMVAMLDARAH